MAQSVVAGDPSLRLKNGCAQDDASDDEQRCHLKFKLSHYQGLAQFEFPSGQLFEVFSPESRYYPLHACPVLAFQVEDVRVARKELESRGVEFVTDVESAESEAWTYFRGPDGYLYELWQTPRPLKALPPN